MFSVNGGMLTNMSIAFHGIWITGAWIIRKQCQCHIFFDVFVIFHANNNRNFFFWNFRHFCIPYGYVVYHYHFDINNITIIINYYNIQFCILPMHF
ncbi:MAG: hypothetical protein [Caudoviricetes sp.]|nr:MAG: hypothetical protein [Caudoviricetes sp.]